jgi:hypothetical protein
LAPKPLTSSGVALGRTATSRATLRVGADRSVVSRIFRTFGWLSGTRLWLTR